LRDLSPLRVSPLTSSCHHVMQILIANHVQHLQHLQLLRRLQIATRGGKRLLALQKRSTVLGNLARSQRGGHGQVSEQLCLSISRGSAADCISINQAALQPK
jgi:hypothetical protein